MITHYYCVDHDKVTEEACCEEAVVAGWVEKVEPQTVENS